MGSAYFPAYYWNCKQITATCTRSTSKRQRARGRIASIDRGVPSMEQQSPSTPSVPAGLRNPNTCKFGAHGCRDLSTLFGPNSAVLQHCVLCSTVYTGGQNIRDISCLKYSTNWIKNSGSFTTVFVANRCVDTDIYIFCSDGY